MSISGVAPFKGVSITHCHQEPSLAGFFDSPSQALNSPYHRVAEEEVIIYPPPFVSPEAEQALSGRGVVSVVGDGCGFKAHPSVKPGTSEGNDVSVIAELKPFAELFFGGRACVVAPLIVEEPFAPVQMNAQDVFSFFRGEEGCQKFFKEAFRIAPEEVIADAGFGKGAICVVEDGVRIFFVPSAFCSEDESEGDEGIWVHFPYFLEGGEGTLKSLLGPLGVHREVHEETVPVNTCVDSFFDLLDERFPFLFVGGVSEEQERRNDFAVINDGASIDGDDAWGIGGHRDGG